MLIFSCQITAQKEMDSLLFYYNKGNYNKTIVLGEKIRATLDIDETKKKYRTCNKRNLWRDSSLYWVWDRSEINQKLQQYKQHRQSNYMTMNNSMQLSL